MPIICKGATGPVVKEIQRRLKKLKHYRGELDGVYGDATSLAVRAFQRSARLPVPNRMGGAGKVDAMTMALLVACS